MASAAATMALQLSSVRPSATPGAALPASSPAAQWRRRIASPAHSARVVSRRSLVCRASAAETEREASSAANGAASGNSSDAELTDISKELSKAVKKTATTFAPRASTKSKNPAVPGSTLYTVFEVQAYLSMAVGGLLSFNLIFPSDEPDLWRLMGMWSIWMFTIPSLRARDCPEAEKTALNYLFLAVPIINVTLPLLWKSFAAVWTADLVAFFAFYAWKMEWFKSSEESK